jgi:MoaA/NifB/PqqE/SkfB family radical SAM enzyme
MSKEMNLTKKLYQNFVVESVKKINKNELETGPLVVEFDPTAVCDLACPGCISEDIIKLGSSFSRERIMSLGEEFIEAGVKAVILIGGGEPLAHPKIGDFMELLGKNDIHIGITTNGTFIDRYLDVIAKYSSWTRISMDAGTTETFKALRPTKGGKSKFDKIVDNMRVLASVKKGKLGFSYLIQTEADGDNVINNIDEIYVAAELAKDIGCDYFEVKPTYNFRNDVAHSLMKHDVNEMNRAKKIIDMLDELEDDNFKILKAINLKYSLNGVDKPQSKNYKKCPSTQLRTLVTPGGAYVCPYWRGKEHMKIGNVDTTSFSEMWKGSLRAEVMDDLDASKDCNFHCLRNDTNIEVLEMIELIKNNKEIESIPEFDRFI